MTEAHPSAEQQLDEWVCACIIGFDDDKGPEAQLLHTGTREACEKVADLLPAVAYNGPRPHPVAHVKVMPIAMWLANTED